MTSTSIKSKNGNNQRFASSIIFDKSTSSASAMSRHISNDDSPHIDQALRAKDLEKEYLRLRRPVYSLTLVGRNITG